MWLSEMVSQVPWIHWKGKPQLRWPKMRWAPQVGPKTICGLQLLHLAALGKDSARSVCAPFRDLAHKALQLRGQETEDRATALSNSRHPAVMLKKRRACAGSLTPSLAHLCRGIISCESPFPQDVEHAPGESVTDVVLIGLIRLQMGIPTSPAGFCLFSEAASWWEERHRLGLPGGTKGHTPEALRAKEWC